MESTTQHGPRIANAPSLLEARALTVRYDDCRDCALEGVSMVLRPGDRVALVGPSGGGKTTLLRALEGSVCPVAGDVRRDGRAVLVYQDLRLVAEETALANVCAGGLAGRGMMAGVFGFPADLEERARGLLADLGMASLAHATVGELSGGQRQRVALARALCARPSVVLADEPFAALDPENAGRIMRLLVTLQQKHGFALVLSTHSPDIAAAYFDRVIEVREGRCAELDAEDYRTASESRAHACVDDCAVPQEVCPLERVRRQDRSLGRDRRWSRRARWGVVGVVLAALVWSLASIEVRGASLTGAASSMAGFAAAMVPASLAELMALPWARLAGSLVQTVQMAILGTALGIGVSLPLALLASRATGPAGVRGGVRLLLNVIRTVPSIIWALLFVAAVGLGPVSGVLALAVYSVGYLTKFFYEGLENVDGRPAEALRALGAGGMQRFFRATLPAARPSLLGACLFVFEYNIRGASVLGIVGAGGIGADLMYHIEWREFPAAAAGLAMIGAVVIALDAASEAWRRRLAAARGH